MPPVGPGSIFVTPRKRVSIRLIPLGRDSIAFHDGTGRPGARGGGGIVGREVIRTSGPRGRKSVFLPCARGVLFWNILCNSHPIFLPPPCAEGIG